MTAIFSIQLHLHKAGYKYMEWDIISIYTKQLSTCGNIVLGIYRAWSLCVDQIVSAE